MSDRTKHLDDLLVNLDAADTAANLALGPAKWLGDPEARRQVEALCKTTKDAIAYVRKRAEKR